MIIMPPIGKLKPNTKPMTGAKTVFTLQSKMGTPSAKKLKEQLRERWRQSQKANHKTEPPSQ